MGSVTLKPAPTRQPPPPKVPPPLLPPGAPRPKNPVCQERDNPCLYPKEWNGIEHGWSSEASAGGTQGSVSSADPEPSRPTPPMPTRQAPRNDDATPEEVLGPVHDTIENDRYHQQRHYDAERRTYVNQDRPNRGTNGPYERSQLPSRRCLPQGESARASRYNVTTTLEENIRYGQPQQRPATRSASPGPRPRSRSPSPVATRDDGETVFRNQIGSIPSSLLTRQTSD